MARELLHDQPDRALTSVQHRTRLILLQEMRETARRAYPHMMRLRLQSWGVFIYKPYGKKGKVWCVDYDAFELARTEGFELVVTHSGRLFFLSEGVPVRLGYHSPASNKYLLAIISRLHQIIAEADKRSTELTLQREG